MHNDHYPATVISESSRRTALQCAIGGDPEVEREIGYAHASARQADDNNLATRLGEAGASVRLDDLLKADMTLGDASEFIRKRLREIGSEGPYDPRVHYWFQADIHVERARRMVSVLRSGEAV
jgi:hypothetical protein